MEVSEKRSIIGDDGLIGADVFSDYLITIDFLWQKLKLQELPRRPGDPEGEATLVSRDTADDEGASRHAPQDRYVSPDMQAYTKVFRFGHELGPYASAGANLFPHSVAVLRHSDKFGPQATSAGQGKRRFRI